MISQVTRNIAFNNVMRAAKSAPISMPGRPSAEAIAAEKKRRRQAVMTIPVEDRRMISVVTQFVAELVWQYADSLCDALAASHDDYRRECRELRNLRRGYVAKRDSILTEDDSAHLRHLSEMFDDTFKSTLVKVYYAVIDQYRDSDKAQRILAVGVVQLRILYKAAIKFMELCVKRLSSLTGLQFDRLVHDEFFGIGPVLDTFSYHIPNEQTFVSLFTNIFNSIDHDNDNNN